MSGGEFDGKGTEPVEGGEAILGMKIVCKELDPKSNCPYVARGANMEELLADLTKHAKAVHNYTDAQINDPKMMEAIKAVVKQE